MDYSNWEPIIGLEIHVQLNTKSKLFSHAPNRFGNEPNTNITDVCTGLPGTLPVLNKEAVRKAVQFGCAVQSHISLKSRFDRKSYFYPDSPRNYQITQFEEPLLRGGVISAKVEGTMKQFPINRAHIEDDSGMLKHFSSFGGIDYNRAGVPLIEIVSEPCMRSAKDAVAYAREIKSIMEYLEASDCNMDEGSLRIDVNVSVRLKTEPGFRNKVEIKNMNSFSNMELAIDAEIRRQIYEYLANPEKRTEEVIRPGTYRFDLEKKATVLMRHKETAEDYRYFPEPDLPPVILSEEYIAEVERTLPELPVARLERYLSKLSLPESTALTLIHDKPVCDYFEKALASCKKPKSLANWILVEFIGRIKDSGKSLEAFGIVPSEISYLVNQIEEGSLTGKIAKSVADDMVKNPSLPCKEIIASNPDYQPIKDASSIEKLIDQVIAENEQSVIDYKAGKTKAFAFLIGQAMKLSKGSASPTLVNEILLKKLS